MSYARYVKAPPTYLSSETPSDLSRPATTPKLHPTKRKGIRLLSPILITIGSLMIANVVWPILQYQVVVAPRIQRTQFLSPIPESELGAALSVASDGPILTPTPQLNQVLGADFDYNKASTWFPTARFINSNAPVKRYHLSIPELHIEDALVIVGGDDLNEGLSQYPGTASPGQLGSPVIFGHSILRQFYNPGENNPRRYHSIFSTIMTLKNGDKIYIDYDGIRYTYEVKDKFEVHPEDVYILEQKFTNKELKLITCVPEGTYLRRGVVVAQLMDIE